MDGLVQQETSGLSQGNQWKFLAKWFQGSSDPRDPNRLEMFHDFEIWLFVKWVCLWNQFVCFFSITFQGLSYKDLKQNILAISRDVHHPQLTYFRLVKNINSASWDENPRCLAVLHRHRLKPPIRNDTIHVNQDRNREIGQHVFASEANTGCALHVTSKKKDRNPWEREREIRGVKVWWVVPDASKRY